MFKKLNIKPMKYLREFENFTDREVKPGDELKVDIFSEGEDVRIAGTSKGLGFQGVMKRHGFSGGNKTHGQSDRLRAPGSVGQSSWPSRVFKGIKMAGRMGTDRVTVPETKVIKIDPEKNLLSGKWVEANDWQGTFGVSHDIAGLAELALPCLHLFWWCYAIGRPG